METPTTPPVQIVQELLAIYTTRKEACERLNDRGLHPAASGRMTAAAKQSEEAIAALMNELSNYGDAVQSEVDREDRFQSTWKEALPRLEAMKPEERVETFDALEKSLREQFAQLEASSDELPDTLRQLITELAGKID